MDSKIDTTRAAEGAKPPPSGSPSPRPASDLRLGPSLEALYTRYGHAVYQRCCYLLRDEDAAWDATQDVFLKAEAARDGFEGRASWSTWLLRIATYHCLNCLRADRRRVARDGAAFEHNVAPRGERDLLARDLLAQFDLKTQRVAVHYFVDEMTQGEIAEAVGLSVPTVRKHIRLFERHARRLWAEGGDPREG
ncbi:sigma-70 family RNA polymerase sigma factor [Myxococcota bacterium]|nr:sigma-70 family RNA polymerase sigma factor [Myxococcota bacterium]MBU1429200.1 sigma-70 family RNA polymerase sigma factor [Myxococcota bacterium]MBU1897158.1 sigma-70 family RNA polymerase sigma factor [Myxococcota bacterium]